MNAKKLGLCNNCNLNGGKYRCPRCSLISCSLACCNQHKLNNNCNGKKDKIEFKPLSAMNSTLLRKDMRFLMNLSSKMRISSRDPLLHHRQDRNTNDRFCSLCSAAKFKKIRLFLQPLGMAKHKNNQTFVIKTINNNNNKNNVLKTIHWTISVQFGAHQLLLHDIDENKTLLSVLNNLKQQKFQTLQTESIGSKINNNNAKQIDYKNDIFDKYWKYLNDINLIRLPAVQRKKHKKSTKNNSQNIARSIIEENVLPNFWKRVSLEVKNEDKLNVIIRIPNHFMYIRINPNQSILRILTQKIINEYPEFIVLTPNEMKKGGYVIMDSMAHYQFKNAIIHNTKIDRQRDKLKIEMNKKLNENKLFDPHKRNRYRYKNNNRNNNNYDNKKRFDKRANNNNNNNGVKARDLFNGTIFDGPGGYQPPMKRMRYNPNNYNKPKTFINPFSLNNTNHNKTQKQQQNNNQNDWYLYL